MRRPARAHRDKVNHSRAGGEKRIFAATFMSPVNRDGVGSEDEIQRSYFLRLRRLRSLSRISSKFFSIFANFFSVFQTLSNVGFIAEVGLTNSAFR